MKKPRVRVMCVSCARIRFVYRNIYNAFRTHSSTSYFSHRNISNDFQTMWYTTTLTPDDSNTTLTTTPYDYLNPLIFPVVTVPLVMAIIAHTLWRNRLALAQQACVVYQQYVKPVVRAEVFVPRTIVIDDDADTTATSCQDDMARIDRIFPHVARIDFIYDTNATQQLPTLLENVLHNGIVHWTMQRRPVISKSDASPTVIFRPEDDVPVQRVHLYDALRRDFAQHYSGDAVAIDSFPLVIDVHLDPTLLNITRCQPPVVLINDKVTLCESTTVALHAS